MKTVSQHGLFGVVVPHAGYAFSGPCAAHSYKVIAESDFNFFIILAGTPTKRLSDGTS